MSGTTQQATWHVTSPDGTEIGVFAGGSGPPIVLVHGATADHTRWQPIVPLLEPHLSVVTMDRRGRGASSDGPDYSVEREFEDVAAVVESAASTFGSPVHLLGHSFGGTCALGAATLTPHLGKLVLYEPAVLAGPEAFPPDLLARLEGLLEGGDREALLETFFREAVMMPEHELAVVRTLPAWQARLATVHTLPRELRFVTDGEGFEPERAAAIAAPTLMLLGGDSPPFVKSETEAVASLLRDVAVRVLAGQQHIAIDLVPELFADHVRSFVTAGD